MESRLAHRDHYAQNTCFAYVLKTKILQNYVDIAAQSWESYQKDLKVGLP